jgi:hypothetical protein
MHSWIAATIAVMVALVPVFAHHGTPINYDNSEMITSKAIVKGFEFKNPHVALFFETTDKDGKVTQWSGEMAAPSVYLRDGWGRKKSEEALKPGTVITVSYFVSKLQESLPPGIGAALVARIRNEKDERILLDRR